MLVSMLARAAGRRIMWSRWSCVLASGPMPGIRTHLSQGMFFLVEAE